MAKKFIENITTKKQALEHLQKHNPDIVAEHSLNEHSPDVHITTAAQQAGFIYNWRGDLFRSFEVFNSGEATGIITLTEVPWVDSKEKAIKHLKSLSENGFINVRDKSNKKRKVSFRLIKQQLEQINDAHARVYVDWALREYDLTYPNYRPL